MAKFESKYSINDEIKFSIRNITFNGKIIGIVFTEKGVFYDVDVDGSIYRSIEENTIK